MIKFTASFDDPFSSFPLATTPFFTIFIVCVHGLSTNGNTVIIYTIAQLGTIYTVTLLFNY